MGRIIGMKLVDDGYHSLFKVKFRGGLVLTFRSLFV